MKRLYSQIITCLLTAGIVGLSTTGCKKNQNTNLGNTDSLPIAITDSSANCTFYPNIPVKFFPSSANVPKGTTFLWNFGDGATSTDEFPAHAYSVGGTYTLTLSFDGGVNKGISHTIYITPVMGSHYTQFLGGIRHWVGSGNYPGGVSYSVDTALTVQVVDSGAVTFPYANGPLYLYYIDTLVENYIVYRGCQGGMLTYYYRNDSMAFDYNTEYNGLGHPASIGIHTK